MGARGIFNRASASAERVSKNGLLVLVATVLGLVVTIVTLVQMLGSEEKPPDRSSPDLLVTSATAYDENVTQFVLPLDAPLDEFPWEPTAGCNPSHREWLESVGAERRRSYLVEMRNADVGTRSQLALDNVRLSGDFTTEPAEPVILFDCPDAGEVDLVNIVQPLESGQQARNVETGAPFGFNLAPGEAGQVRVDLDGASGFTGDLLVDVSSGTDTATQRLLPEPLDLPAVGRWGAITVSVGPGAGVFYCESEDLELFDECRASDIPALVQEYARAR